VSAMPTTEAAAPTIEEILSAVSNASTGPRYRQPLNP
jgi:hypothetical protein